LHVWHRGVDGQACFRENRDFRMYMGLLEEFMAERRCAVHGHVLMTNHVHILLTPTDDDGCSRFMKDVAQRYTQYVNRTWKRTGPLWEGRFKSCLVDSHLYLITCQRYIELNPVRAKMVEHPARYPWSSFRANALGEPSPVTIPHAVFWSLGTDEQDARRAYLQLFDGVMAEDELRTIRESLRAGRPLGTADFIADVERQTGWKLPRGKAQPRTGTVRNGV
jgi:putative transposase